ncbi:Os01g0619900, partial [Oryza sativa Japonica Group]
PVFLINFAEVNNTAQNFVHFTEEEEDLVFRMHRLVGNRYPNTHITYL